MVTEYEQLMAESELLLSKIASDPEKWRRALLGIAGGITNAAEEYANMLEVGHPVNLTRKQLGMSLMMEMKVADSLLIRSCLLLAAAATFDECGYKKESPRG